MSNTEKAKYKCDYCGKRFSIVYTGWYPTKPCPKCGKTARIVLDIPEPTYDPNKNRVGLTKHQKKLLGWQRNEKKWIEDIKSRKKMPDGSIGRFIGDRRIG